MTVRLRPSDVIDAPEPLLTFNRAGVLEPIDVHAAVTIARLSDETHPDVLLAAALAVRATRLGHVRLDLASVKSSVGGEDVDRETIEALPWPDLGAWSEALGQSPLTEANGPLVLDGTAVYLGRYWAYEQSALAALRERMGAPSLPPGPAAADLIGLLVRSLAKDETEEVNRQRVAVAVALSRPLAVIAGGPGTGKTWTISRYLAAVLELAHAEGKPFPSVAMAAPTGKAAQRITSQIQAARTSLATEGLVSPETLDAMAKIEASTLHRLLGWHHERGRFRHDRNNPLTNDVVVVDEMSMVSLSMMASLLDAVSPSTTLILVGDPNQLVSIEAGSVIGDIVGPADDAFVRLSERFLTDAGHLLGALPPSKVQSDAAVLDTIVVLDRPRRFGDESPVAALAKAIKSGDPESTRVALAGVERQESTAEPIKDPNVTSLVSAHLELLTAAAESSDIEGAIDLAGKLAVLCASHRGPRGVMAWNEWAESWHKARKPGKQLPLWYAGRPVMVTQNDYRSGLFNGDIGVTVSTEAGLRVAFPGPDEPRLFTPTRLADVTSVYAMTIHKSQGSEFKHVIVMLPDPSSPLATRELLYTAVTRASERLTIIGEEASLLAALDRRVQRASGLGQALWGAGP